MKTNRTAVASSAAAAAAAAGAAARFLGGILCYTSETNINQNMLQAEITADVMFFLLLLDSRLPMQYDQ